MNPLADRIRPTAVEEVFGQRHLLGEGRLLRKIIESSEVPNMIFYGPSGVGKTTVANIIASRTGRRIYKLNATNASVADIKGIAASLGGIDTMNGVLLYLDEIQNFNKKQQQSLLEFMENGKITLIASTTENPYFYVYNAVLSRSVVFEFRPIAAEDVRAALERGIHILTEKDYKGLTVDPMAVEHIANTSNGDIRKALNVLEICILAASPDAQGHLHVELETAEQAVQRKAIRHDKDGDSHYDIVSAFQKSMRGSDPDAAVYYLARLLEAGDMQSACRRLLVTAAEDVGLAYPQAITIVKSCIDAALQLGLPEARIPLAEAVILIATAPKSNSAIMAVDAAMEDLSKMDTGYVPNHLRDRHYSGAEKMGHGQGYQYVHEYAGHYVKQQYLPDEIKDRVYYRPGENKNERAAKEYWDRIKKQWE